MQTFLPYKSFHDSAEILDKKRCWKQVVEAKQIISVLSHIYDYPGNKVPWMNHPAVKMWEGHIPVLKEYFNNFLIVSVNKHKINTDYETYPGIETSDNECDYPWWLGNKEFHRAMRARLIEKDKDFYLDKFPDDKGFNGGKYFWPNMDGTNTFRII